MGIFVLIVMLIVIALLGQWAIAVAVIGSAVGVGSVGFWLLAVVSTGMLFFFIDDNDGVAATLTVLGFFLIMQLFGGVPVFSYIRHNPWDAVAWFAKYFAVGTVWCVARWILFSYSELGKYKEEKSDFLADHKITGDVIPKLLKSAWEGIAPEKPLISRSKARCMRWISFWPWNMVWYVINDPVKRLCKWIYRSLQGLLQRITDKIWAGTAKDFA